MAASAYFCGSRPSSRRSPRVPASRRSWRRWSAPPAGGPVAPRDGRVGVLLRVEDPHEHVGERDEPVHLEVVRHLGRVVVGETYADGREIQPGEGVEGRGLARAGGPGDPDDGVVGRQPQPAGAALDHGRRAPDELVVQASARGLGGGAQPLEAGAGVGATGDQLPGPLQQGRHDPPTRSTLFVVLAHTLGGRCAQCSRWALEKRTSSTRRAATRSASGASSLRPRPSTRAV